FRWAIFEFDLAARKLRRTGTMPEGILQFAISPDGSRILGRDTGWKKLLFIDGRTGTVDRALLNEAKANIEAPSASFLSDGRAAGLGPGPGGLPLFPADGRFDRVLPLGDSSAVRVLGEPVPGKVVVYLPATKTVGIVDLATGNVVRIPNLRPLSRSFWLDEFQ